MSASSVQKISKAARIAAEIAGRLHEMIRPGMTELQAASAIRKAIKKAGGEKESFRIIVAAGHRTALPHGYATKNRIRRNDIVMVDFGAVYKGYCSDITRMVFMDNGGARLIAAAQDSCNDQRLCADNGEARLIAPLLYRKIYRIVTAAQLKAICMVRPGMPVRKIDLEVRKIFRKHRLEKYFPHSTGHGIGLKVHEEPRISYRKDDILKAGMVITIEPGLYFKGKNKFGIRIEDMVLVTKNGHKVLT